MKTKTCEVCGRQQGCTLDVASHFDDGTRVRHKLGLECESFIRAYTFAIVPCRALATGRRRVKLEVHGWAGKRRLPDRDAWDKQTLDALVHCGLLLDDDADGLDGRMEVEIVRSKTRKTIITLEDCDEEADAQNRASPA